MSNQAGAATDRGAADKVKDKIGDATDQVKDRAASATAEVREAGGHLVDEGKEKARELSHRAGEAARSRADQEKERVTQGMRSVAEALRKGGQELPADRSQYRPLLTNVADRVEDVSGYLEARDVDALTQDVRRFARDHTPLFLGGAFALGVIGARFLKSSGSTARSGQFDQDDAAAGYDGPDRHGRLLPEHGTDGSEPADHRGAGGFNA
ncbi:hypothetical protein BH23GEM10_BH23GEM10_13660 [soil metagenome]